MSEGKGTYETPDDSYKALNVGAHRKPAPLCGAPSLTWHRAFWRNHDDADTWHRNIDAFLFGIFQRCLDLTADPKDSNAIKSNDFSIQCHNIDKNQKKVYLFRHGVGLKDENRDLSPLDKKERFLRYDVFSLQLDLAGITLSIRAELFRELWTLTFILDFDKFFPQQIHETESVRSLANIIFKPSNPTNNEEKKPLNQRFNPIIHGIARQIDKIQGSITQRFLQHRNKDIAIEMGSANRDDLSGVRSRIITEFRGFCEETVLEAADKWASQKQGQNYHSPCNRKIAEFFGSVFGIETTEQAATPISTYITEQPDKKSRLTIHSLIGNGLYEVTNAHRLIDAAWPFIHELHLVNPINVETLSERKPEFSGSLFQDKRSLYISSLGRLNPNANYSRGETEPVVFTIFVCHRSRWQIGRIVERMHNLGVCRVVALWNLDSITDAGNQLYELRKKLDSQMESDPNGMQPADAAKQIASIQASVSDGGLSYRVERTRYYVKQINNLLRTLRIDRIEGFQPYDQFIQRRLYGTFDFIERIGVLYADLRSEITLQLDRQRTQQFMKLASDITHNTEAIQAYTAATSSRQKTTNLLLDNAEILIALPVFYYFGQIISYVFYDMSNIDSLDFLRESKILPFILSAIITFFLVRYFRHRHEDAVRARKEK
jgi:hypothetical protein